MVYYFKESLKLGLNTTYETKVNDEKAMRKNWVAKFWSIDIFYINNDGDYIYHHQYPLYYRNKKIVVERLLTIEEKENFVNLLVLHTIDKYRFHWLDFFEVIKLEDGTIKVKKLRKKQVFIDKNGSVVDERGKTIAIDYDLYNII